MDIIDILKIIDLIAIILIVILQIYFLTKKNLKEKIFKIITQVILIIMYIGLNTFTSIIYNLYMQIDGAFLPSSAKLVIVIKYILGIIICIRTLK